MKFNSTFGGLLVSSVLSLSAQARTLSAEEKLSDLDQLASIMRAGYGPLRYKEEALGIRLEDKLAEFKKEALQTQTNGQYYYAIVRFVASFQDSHFSAWIPTNVVSELPFSTDLVQGKVLIDQIDRSRLPESTFPFVRGDEVVAIDGTPVAQIVDELAKYTGNGFDQTARRRASMMLSWRPARTVPAPEGVAQVTIRHGQSAILETVALTWKKTGQPLDEADGWASTFRVRPRTRSSHPFDQVSTKDVWIDFAERKWERSFRCSGDTRIDIPKEATIIMMSPFVAYYHPTAKGNVGYLRIPHYSPENEITGADEYALRFSQYEYAVAELEKNTVGLIIDQDHNCGGSVNYLHQVASLFINENFSPMIFRLLATKEQYLDIKSWTDETDSHTLEHQFLQKTLDTLYASWKAGSFMTDKVPLAGEEFIHPHSVRYTKPIVMLIDEMSGSGGDAFPALLQGAGRAKLLGTRTMGAGGHVQEQPPLAFSRVNFRMTKSLFFRPDGVPVENNGTLPDIPYEITRDDFMYGYKGYQAFYLSKLLELIP